MTQTDTPIAEMADRLTAGERRSMLEMSDVWQAGPMMDDVALSYLPTFRERGIVEREFGDMGEPSETATESEISFRISACWWFRLTPLGSALRSHLMGGSDRG